MLNKNLAYGAIGDDVKSLQEFLISAMYLEPGYATGYFGRLTEAGVRAYQEAAGIVSSGTPSSTGFGRVGPMTRAKLSASEQMCGLGYVSKAPGTAATSPTEHSSAVSLRLEPEPYNLFPETTPQDFEASTASQIRPSLFLASAAAIPVPSDYAQTAIRIENVTVPTYPTPSGLIAYRISGGTVAAHTPDGTTLWSKPTTHVALSGGADNNSDGYPEVVTASKGDSSCTGSTSFELHDGKTGARLKSYPALANICFPHLGYGSMRWHIGAALLGGSSVMAAIPQYYPNGWFTRIQGTTPQDIGTYYASDNASFDAYTAAQPHIPESMTQNGLIMSDAAGDRLVAFSSGRVLQYRVGPYSTSQLISDTPLVTGGRPETGGRNYGLVTRSGNKIVLISGTPSYSLYADVKSGSRSYDPWAGIARHVAIFDTTNATVLDRFYSYAYDGGTSHQYVNRVAYPSHALVSINGTPHIFFNVFDGTRWYVSVNTLALSEVARITDTFLWDTIAKADGSRRFVISKTSGYWPQTPHTFSVAQFSNNAFVTEETKDGIPVMALGMRTPDISASNGYLARILVTETGIVSTAAATQSNPLPTPTGTSIPAATYGAIDNSASGFSASVSGSALFDAATPNTSQIRPWIGFSNCPSCGTQNLKQKIVFKNSPGAQSIIVTVRPYFSSSAQTFTASATGGTIVSGASKAFPQGTLNSTHAWQIRIDTNQAGGDVELTIGNSAQSGTNYLYLDQIGVSAFVVEAAQ